MTDSTLIQIRESKLRIKKFEAEYKFKLIDIPDEIGYKFESPSFICSGSEWCFEIWPKGRPNPKRNDGIYVYLKLKNYPPALPVRYTIGTIKADGSFFRVFGGAQLFEKEQRGYASAKYLERPILLKDFVLSDGTVAFFCEIYIEDCDITAKPDVAPLSSVPGGDEMLSKNLKELLRNGHQADVTFSVKNKQFSAHRCILAARSEVFRSLFELDMSEKANSIVNIEDCNPDVFEKFLLFLYSGNFGVVTGGNFLDLYLIAYKYKVMQLQRLCMEKLPSKLSVESICDFVYLASLSNNHEWLKTATDFFIDNFDVIVKTPKWLSLLSDHLKVAYDLLVKMAKKFDKESKGLVMRQRDVRKVHRRKQVY